MLFVCVSVSATEVPTSTMQLQHLIANQQQLGKAIDLRKENKPKQAISVLSPLLKQARGSEKRVRFELLLNFIKLKQYALAEQQLSYLLQLPLTAKEQQKLVKIEDFLAKQQITEITAQHTFSGYAALYYGSDNISTTAYVSDSFVDSFFDENSGQYVYNVYSFTQPTEDKINQQLNYHAERMQLNYQFQSAHSKNDGKSSYWQFNSSLQAYNRQVPGRDLQQDQLIWQNRLSFYQSGWQWFVQSDIKLQEREYQHQLTEPKWLVQMSMPLPSSRLAVGYSWQQQKYQPITLDNGIVINDFYQDSIIAKPYANFRYALNSQTTLELGVKYQRQHAKNADYSNRTLYYYTQVDYQINDQFSTNWSFNYHRLTYDNNDLQYYWWGKEYARSVNAQVNYQITKHWSLSLSGVYYYKNTDNQLIDTSWRRAQLALYYRF